MVCGLKIAWDYLVIAFQILLVWEMVGLYFYSSTFFIVMVLKSLRGFHFWSDREGLTNLSDVG